MAAQIGFLNYDILVKFDLPDGSTYWSINIIIFQLHLTLQMAALLAVLNIIIF